MASIVDQTRMLIANLFSNKQPWTIVTPNDVRVATLAPSKDESKKLISCADIYVGDLQHVQKIKDQLLQVHFCQPVSDTFWNTVCDQVMRGISGPLFSYSCRPDCRISNESSVRSFLIEPVIRELATHLSHLPEPPPNTGTFFTASISMEHTIRLHSGAGRPASVDFCILLHGEDGSVINIVPGEAKVVIMDKDIQQLSTYMWKIGTSREYQGRCVVGILMDHQYYSVAFAPCMYADGRSVPITLVSPRVVWRDVSLSPSAVAKTSLLFLSSLFLANMSAQTVGEDFSHVRAVSDAFYKDPLRSIDRVDDVRLDYSGLIRDLKQLKEEVKELRAEDNKKKELIHQLKSEDEKQRKVIQNLQQETDFHGRMLDFVQAAVSPTRPSRSTASPVRTPQRKRKRASSAGPSDQ